MEGVVERSGWVLFLRWRRTHRSIVSAEQLSFHTSSLVISGRLTNAVCCSCEKRLKEEQARRDECTALRHMLEQERARAQGKRRRLNSSSTASTADTRVDDDPDGAEETFIKLTTPVDLARRVCTLSKTFTFFSLSLSASSIMNMCCVVCTICSWVDSLATFVTSRFCKQKKKIFDYIANRVDPKYVFIYRRFSSSLSWI